LFFLIALGGAYGLLLLAGRWSPSFASLLPWSAIGMNEQLKLPLFAQLASLFAGLAALVLVLSRAVREVDTRPYLAVAPVIAVFAGLVHAGLRVDLSASGLSGAQVAFAALAVALLGGTLITRDDNRAQLFGWTLVFAPGALVLLVLTLAKAPEAALEPAERAYLVGLFVSTALLGGAGAAARTLRARSTLFSYADPVASTHLSTRAAADLSSRSITHISTRAAVDQDDSFTDFLRAETEEPGFYADGYAGRLARIRDRLFARAQTALMVVAVVVAAYFIVDHLRHSGNATQPETASALMAPTLAPVVEQLGDTSRGREAALAGSGTARRARTDKPRGGKASGERASGFATREAHEPMAISAPAPVARAQNVESRRKTKPTRASRVAAARAATKAQAHQSVALPAWGAEAIREFEPAKAGKSAPTPTHKSSALVVSKPVAASTSSAKPMFATKPIASPSKSFASVPVTPPKPAAPPPPSKPLTLNQLLNKVEDAAHAQQKGKKEAPSKPKSKGDSELDDLINKAVHEKGK
jgi:hypothetical protein